MYSHMRNRCHCGAFICYSDFYSIVLSQCLLGSTDERKIKMRFPQEVTFSLVSCGGVCPCVSHLFPQLGDVYSETLLVVI